MTPRQIELLAKQAEEEVAEELEKLSLSDDTKQVLFKLCLFCYKKGIDDTKEQYKKKEIMW